MMVISFENKISAPSSGLSTSVSHSLDQCMHNMAEAACKVEEALRQSERLAGILSDLERKTRMLPECSESASNDAGTAISQLRNASRELEDAIRGLKDKFVEIRRFTP